MLTSNHLLAGKQLSLVLVDNGVTCGRSAILVPGNRTLEISRVCQTIGSCKGKVTVANGLTDVVPSVRLFLFRPLSIYSRWLLMTGGTAPWTAHTVFAHAMGQASSQLNMHGFGL